MEKQLFTQQRISIIAKYLFLFSIFNFVGRETPEQFYQFNRNYFQ